MQSVFITGTDTGIGKTLLSAALLAAAHRAGHQALPMKPVQTGCTLSQGKRSAPDLEYCLRAACMNPDQELRDLMAPYCFTLPASPHLAAREEGATVSVERIVHCFRALTQDAHPAVIVEGAGGVKVPLNETDTMIDLMVALALPVLLVARPSLGTINHTLLSIDTLRDAGLQLLGVVFVGTEPCASSLIEGDNGDTIARLGQTHMLGHIPYFADFSESSMGAAELDHTARTYLGILLERMDIEKGHGTSQRVP